MIKISIIIPVYNVENYLSQCLDSVINQTLNDIEIICINDGSTDNSLSILKDYANKDNRIKIISKENEGQAIARNLGIKEAKGEYIAFVDSDDFVELDMFENLYYLAKKRDLDLVMCKIALFDNKTKNINYNSWYYKLGVFEDFDKTVFNYKDTKEFTCEISVTPYNKIYKTSLLRENNISFPEGLIFEDEKFFYDVYLKSNKVSIFDKFLYYYRTNRSGSTVDKNKENDYSDLVLIYKLIRQSFKDEGNYEEYKVLLANRLIHLELVRFTQTSEEYKENYFNLLKDDLKEVLSDLEIKNNLTANVKSRVFKILNSNNYNEFKVLDENKIFSIVMACYNCEEYLDETIKSILGQNFSFESNIQLILVDDGSNDGTADICQKYVDIYPDNIIYLYQENQGQGAARNFGLKYVKAKYVNFLDSDDKFSGDTFTNVYDFFEKHYDEVDLVSVSVKFFDRHYGHHPLNYKYEKTRVIDLNKEYDCPQLSASSAFFKSELFKKYNFKTDLVNSEDALMINKILIEKQAYGVIEKGIYWYRKRKDESSTIDSVSYKKDFYLNRLNGYFKELINYYNENLSHVPKFIQYLLIYDLQWMFRVKNINEILSNDEIKEVYLAIDDILTYIEDGVILSLRDDILNFKHHILAIKHGNIIINFDGSVSCENIHSKFNGDFVGVYSGNVLVDRLNYHKLWLDILEIKGNILYISGLLMSFFNSKDISIGAIKNNTEVFESKEVYYSNIFKKFLGCTIESPYNFDIEVPLNDKEYSTVEIFVKYNKDNIYYNLDINFQDYVRLSKKSNYSISGNHFLEFKDNKFYISPYNYGKMIKKEFSILHNIFKAKEPYYTSVLVFRFVYLLLYPFYRNKRIWLFMDRRESADDNAEHLYNYAINQKDGIKKYFTVSKDSDDFNRLYKLGNVLAFYSIKQRLVYLFAEKIISSHPDEIILNPFMGKNIRLYAGLINSDKVFLQHGVTKDNISSWLRKYDKNLKLIVTVSDKERESFFEQAYNYDDNVVQTLGFPRFDNLFEINENSNEKLIWNNDEVIEANHKSSSIKTKKIVIMPSWREELHNKSHSQIKDSQYFKHINSLLNNEKLINLTKEYGYEILFKPHPLVYNFIELFDTDSIIVDENTKYQDLFKMSNLMITDYSSVAFDFSYMKKPVIYYQYGDDYNFKKGYFDYRTMGFGEVVNNEDELVNILEKYLETNCKMKEEYKNRVDSFYKYNDKKNCKRVYDAILNLL